MAGLSSHEPCRERGFRDTGVMASVWLPLEPLLLASTSSTRRVLLESAAIPVEASAPDVDERALEAEHAGLSLPELAKRLAECKAASVAAHHPDRIVIGADQVLEFDGRAFHKPAHAAEAHAQLMRLSGSTHRLHTAVALAGRLPRQSFVDTARLTFRRLDARAIADYIACAGEDRVTASVGGYQLEGPGIHLMERVEGDHSTVLGLPLLPLLARLRAAGCLRF